MPQSPPRARPKVACKAGGHTGLTPGEVRMRLHKNGCFVSPTCSYVALTKTVAAPLNFEVFAEQFLALLNVLLFLVERILIADMDA